MSKGCFIHHCAAFPSDVARPHLAYHVDKSGTFTCYVIIKIIPWPSSYNRLLDGRCLSQFGNKISALSSRLISFQSPLNKRKSVSNNDKSWLFCSGRIPRLSLIRHSLYVGVVEKPPPHHSQGSSTERWSRSTLRVVTARLFYVLRGILTSPFILSNSVETAAPFNVVSHPRCSEPRN